MRILVNMKGVLLVICCKFKSEYGKCNESKKVVRDCERVMRLENGSSVCRETKEEEENVLGNGDKEEVGELEEQWR